MSAKLLVPLDGSEGARQAVEYVAHTFGQTPGVEVRLLHVLPGIPPSLWDDGHILNAPERRARHDQLSAWEKHQEEQWQGILAQARDRLIQFGIPPEAISVKFTPKYSEVATDILDEAANEGFTTIVIGRRGVTGAKHLRLGSVSSQIVHHAQGLAVLIVDHTQPRMPREALAKPRRSRGEEQIKPLIDRFWEKLIYLSKYWCWI